MKKLIKRGFAALLALTLALGMSVSAFAVEGTTDTETAVAKKVYQQINSNTTSPAEDFHFTAKAVSVTDANNPDGSAVTLDQMPSLTITPVSYAAGGAGSVDSADSKRDLLVKPDKDFPSVGIYTYEVTETDGKTAGVGYNKEKLELKVTVFHDVKTGEIKVGYAFRVGANKGANIVNTYSAGSLHVGKHVHGNLGNKTQKFNINVTFTAPEGQTVNSTITYGDKQITPEDFKSGNGTVTVQIGLADEDVMVFQNVPYGVKYKVQEDKYEGYKTTYSETDDTKDHVEGTINARFTVADIFNEKTGSVDTGVILHSAPYVLLLVGVGAAAVAFLILKKHREV